MLGLFALPALAFEPYPMTDPDLLALTRIETEALWLAVKKSGTARARYARTAVAAYQQRAQLLSPAVLAAERATEREGTGQDVTLDKAYAADDVRAWALATGHAMGVVLDDLDRGWRDDDRPLDELLDEATRGQRSIPLYDDIQGAREDTTELRGRINDAATNYLVTPGYTLQVLGSFPETSADPLVAYPLEDGAVLHRGDVRFEGPAGSLTVQKLGAWVDRDEIRVLGLDRREVSVDHEGQELVVKGPGVELRLRGGIASGDTYTLTVQVVPHASMDADPAVFALFSLATAAGWQAVPPTRIPSSAPDAQLRARMRDAGAACTTEIDAFHALAATDDASLRGMTAETVVLGGPPTFAPDRDAGDLLLAEQRDGRFATLPELLASFWTCAGLEQRWADERQAAVDLGQQALARAADPLARAMADVPAEHRPEVRIVPNPLGKPGQGFAVTWGDEVSVVLGPPVKAREGVDPAIVVHEALHHLVDPVVRGRPCPSLDPAFEAVRELPAVVDVGPTADAWLAESIVRALTIEAGTIPGGLAPDAASKAWAEQGFSLVPGIVAGLQRGSAEAWVNEQCGED